MLHLTQDNAHRQFLNSTRLTIILICILVSAVKLCPLLFARLLWCRSTTEDAEIEVCSRRREGNTLRIASEQFITYCNGLSTELSMSFGFKS